MNRAEKRRQKKLAERNSRQGQPAALNPQQIADLQGTLNRAVELHGSGNLSAAEELYQKALKIDPNQPVALHFIGLVALQTGHVDVGVERIRKAISIAPDYTDAHINLGNALQELNQLDEADGLYRKALQLAPKSAQSFGGLGSVLHKKGQLDEAVTCLQSAISLNPTYGEAHNNLGIILDERGQFEQAVQHYQAALKIDSNDAEVWRNLGISQQNRGHLKEAEECFLKALEITPDFAEAQSNLGIIYKETERLKEAVESHQKSISIQPQYKQAHLNLGVALKELNRFEAAVDSYHKALAIDPHYVEAYLNLSIVLKELKRFAEAEDCCRKAIKVQPESAEAHLNLGTIIRKQMKPKEAILHFNQALKLNPDLAEGYSDLSFAQQDLGMLDEAEENLHIALRLQPEFKKAQNNLSHLQLLKGDFKNGFAGYDSRLDMLKTEEKAIFQKSRWAGEDLTGKCLALFSEQGVGDEILFSSILADLNKNDIRLVVECDERLLPIYKRSFKDITLVGKARPHDQALSHPNVDFQIEIGGLGEYFRSDIKDFPTPVAFLKPNSNRVAKLRERYLEQSKGRPIVGISWRSGNYRVGAKKSIELNDWLPILSNPDYAFLNLQYGNVDEELRALKEQSGLEIFQDKDIDPLKDMDGFFDQVGAVDMVISISNATVHTAGALGKKTWLLLPFVPPVWCWQMNREDSLWYPNIKIFRQPEYKDWDSVIDTVAQELRDLD